MLDLSYVYMDIYLPTAEAGKAKIGNDARIVLDARPVRLRAHADKVKSGVPGVAYVKLDPQMPWPEGLQGSQQG